MTNEKLTPNDNWTVPENLTTIVKPEELVDVVEMAPLTLHDRRTYNLLLGKAWNTILVDKIHIITPQELTEHISKSHNHNFIESIERLMKSIVKVKIRNKVGKSSTTRIQLVSSNTVMDNGAFAYRFSPELVAMIGNSTIFARLRTKIMFDLSSKYSLALYEWIQKRVNLSHIDHETISLEAFRGLLGVPKGKLDTYGNLNKFAISIAVKDVNSLTEYSVKVEPQKTGRAITHLKISWKTNTSDGPIIDSIQGNLDLLSQKTTSSLSHKTNSSLNTPLIEKGKQLAIEAGTGWDILAIKKQFIAHAEKNGMPNNIETAFLGFVKLKIKNKP